MTTLREARLAKFISQEDLAKKSGVGRSTVATIEGGTPPRLRTARLLAAALGVEPGEIDWPKGKPGASGNASGHAAAS